MATFSWTYSATATSSVARPSDPVQREQDRLFGKDIAMPRGLLQVSKSGDYITVNGLENLRFSLLRRFATSAGDFAHRPNYGLGAPSFVGRRRNQALLDEFRNAAEEQALDDARISSARIAVEAISSGMKVTMRLVAQGNTLSFRPFTVTEEKVS